MKIFKRLLAFAMLSTMVIASAASPTHAQSSGLQISPTRNNLKLLPGQSSSQMITVKNIGKNAVTANVSFVDFVSDPKNPGAPALLMDGKQNEKYGLSKWISGTGSIYLPAGASTNYTYKVTIPANAAPRTYFSAVVFKQAGQTGEQTASVASLVFADVGQPVIKGNIERFELAQEVTPATGNTDIKLEIEISNTGDGLFTPELEVIVRGGNDQDAVSGSPEKTGGILPGSKRVFSVNLAAKLDPEQTYTATVTDKAKGSVLGSKDLTVYKPAPPPAKDTEAPPKKSMLPFIILAAAALLAIVTVALILVRRRKDHKQPVITATPVPPSAPAGFQSPSSHPQNPQPTVVQPNKPDQPPTNPTLQQ